MTNPISEAVDIVGLANLATGLGVTYQAIRKWEHAGRMPRTEWTGETQYGEKIQALTDGKVTKDRLLQGWTPPDGRPSQSEAQHADSEPAP